MIEVFNKDGEVIISLNGAEFRTDPVEALRVARDLVQHAQKARLNKGSKVSLLAVKQRKFVKNIGLLIAHAYNRGYELSLGDGYRDPRAFGYIGEKKNYGSANSNHKVRLAQDFNLFIEGIWMKKTEDFTDMGEYWESLDKENTWGGRFNSPDGNHFSMEYNGRK